MTIRTRWVGFVVFVLMVGSVLADRAAAQVWAPRNTLITGDLSQESLGEVLHAVDLDLDGDSELCVGAPALDGQRGKVLCVTWLAGTPSSVYSVAGTVEGYEIGAVFASGDFDDDGKVDLAYGVPGYGPTYPYGIVQVFEWTGLTSSYVGLFSQGTADVPGASEDGDGFGAALAVGDFDNDGYDDLAAGIPGFDASGPIANAGAVQILFGALFADGFEDAGWCAWAAPACL